MAKTKIKTKAIIGALSLLIAATGITGYKIVKTKDYSGMGRNLHEVVKVIDGDTFEIVNTENEQKISVRILNIS